MHVKVHVCNVHNIFGKRTCPWLSNRNFYITYIVNFLSAVVGDFEAESVWYEVTSELSSAHKPVNLHNSLGCGHSGNEIEDIMQSDLM